MVMMIIIYKNFFLKLVHNKNSIYLILYINEKNLFFNFFNLSLK